MPVAAMLSGAVHQPLDLALGEVSSLDCQVYDAWGAFLGCRFHADKLCMRVSDYLAYALFLNSQFTRDRAPSSEMSSAAIEIIQSLRPGGGDPGGTFGK